MVNKTVQDAIREQFARYGAQGGEKAAERMTKKARLERARKAGMASAAARAKRETEKEEAAAKAKGREVRRRGSEREK